MSDKKNAVALTKSLTPAQKAARTRAAAKAEADRLERANAAQLAQIVNLMIAGYTLSEIGSSIGATEDEVDRLLQRDAARYVRNQPQLRTYVRNWITKKYTDLLDADWTQATDKNHAKQLEYQDRAIRILDSMRKLHGADAPVQAEVKVDAAPEAVEAMVAMLAASSGVGYDVSVFDVVDAEVVHDAADEAEAALEAADAAVGDVSGNEGEDDGF